jgi:hypothetical protein
LKFCVLALPLATNRTVPCGCCPTNLISYLLLRSVKMCDGCHIK